MTATKPAPLKTPRSAGRCRSIGISNFLRTHLEELLSVSSVVPAVNQVELHPALTQEELRGYCAGRGIRVEAYSPLGCGKVGLLV